ncbi:hypothetical protein COCON_G00071950 [Conger conger]|uniref:RNA-binding protein 14 n=1 Tax=Conger conger TaxID=82655 RepID=A0A9Q1DMT0_CONCO|nr:hypothetical protein COCON_G00071950 [Conger conger]
MCCFRFVEGTTEEERFARLALNSLKELLSIRTYTRDPRQEVLHPLTSPPSVTMVKIFVGNVNSSTTEAELRELFEKHGAVSDCDILKNYGFVHMDEEDAAQKAVSALHKHELNGSRITVEYATTKVRNATKIYVGNVPEGASAGKIKELFQRYGKVVECDIVKNYAFVHMQRENEALEAIAELNHSKMEGQKIFVSLSRSNQARDGRGDDFPPTSPTRTTPHPHYLPPAPRASTTTTPGAACPPRPRPAPPPRGYYDYDPYASRYYERDPYERRPPLPQRPLSPPPPSPRGITASGARPPAAGPCCPRPPPPSARAYPPQRRHGAPTPSPPNILLRLRPVPPVLPGLRL